MIFPRESKKHTHGKYYLSHKCANTLIAATIMHGIAQPQDLLIMRPVSYINSLSYLFYAVNINLKLFAMYAIIILKGMGMATAITRPNKTKGRLIMPKGFGGMPPNMNNLMKQAQKMQKKMEETQAELENRTLETSSGGGVVKVSVNGKKEILDITIDPDAVDPDDVEMLQDLLISAVNEALRQMDELVQNEMSKVMPAGMPGLF